MKIIVPALTVLGAVVAGMWVWNRFGPGAAGGSSG